MRPTKIKSLRTALLRRMDDLRSVATKAISNMKNSDDRYSDLFDQAAVESYMFNEASFRNRERQTLLEIRETIRRIDMGEFGICTRCGKTISPKRLFVAPLSKTCVSCQEILETQTAHTRYPR
jgi:DnaK suppressor protein